MQVDLFFYRDPEEAKEQEEEAPVATDFGQAAGNIGGLPNDQWSADQWLGAEVGSSRPPVLPITGGTEWTAAPQVGKNHLNNLILLHL